MADQQASPFSDADIQSLAQKLKQFNQTLTPGEQEAMAFVALSGIPMTPDTKGFIQSRQERMPLYQHPPTVSWYPIIQVFAPGLGYQNPGERR
jgi:hypothetical protein